jgi:hypothetical protein
MISMGSFDIGISLDLISRFRVRETNDASKVC